ncbi:type II secretion system F family protein [Actinopolymorpha alba]|uniref:type II secretion system F family protein n=1 Tax=Actinopolymorpha alba TaxID=533267 RepID=UPI00035F32AD|nr:type II secretion system F family protein [Actinopolymorpha alba]
MTALAGLLAGLAVLFWWWPVGSRRRLVSLRPAAGWEGGGSAGPMRSDHGGATTGIPARPARVGQRHLGQGRARWLVAAFAGLVAGFVVGGGAGFVAGAVVAVLLGQVLARLEPRESRIRRERLAAELPLAADLLAACLRAGHPPGLSIEVIGRGMRGPLAAELRQVAAALRLGSDAQTAWSGFLEDSVLAPFGRSMVRVWDTGAPLASTLERLADDARQSRRADADQRARAVGVKAAAPLGLCFLPAFVLVGVVPLVAGAVTGLLR